MCPYFALYTAIGKVTWRFEISHFKHFLGLSQKGKGDLFRRILLCVPANNLRKILNPIE